MSNTGDLLFSDEELVRLVERRKNEPVGRLLHNDIMSKAWWVFGQPIPSCPKPYFGSIQKQGKVKLGQSSYSDEYLLTHEAFENVTFAYERAVIQLSFVYRITNENMWADKAIEWIKAALFEWEYWGPAVNELDQFAVRVMYATALACDMLKDILENSMLERAFKILEKYTEKCLKLWGQGIEEPNPLQLGNHFWFNISMVGITSFWLGQNNKKWINVALKCCKKIDNLIDWAIGPDGDYLDKPNFLMYAFRYALLLLYIQHKKVGIDALKNPKLLKAAWWICDLICPGNNNFVTLSHTSIIENWIFMLLASKHGDFKLQRIALNINNPVNTNSISSFTIWQGGLGSVWAYLFYDENIEFYRFSSEKSEEPRWYRWSGYGVIGSLADKEMPKVVLYAGPHSGKSMFNQGQLYVCAFGEFLVGEPVFKINSYITAHKWCGYYNSCLSDMVATIDGLGQATGNYPGEWPGNQLIGHKTCKPIAEILNVKKKNEVSSITAELTGAYRNFNPSFWGTDFEIPEEWRGKKSDRLKKYIRKVHLISDKWLIINDTIIGHEMQPIDITLHFCTSGHVELPDDRIVIIENGKAAMDMYLFSPDEAKFSVKPAYYSETGKNISINLVNAQGSIEFVIVCYIRSNIERKKYPEINNLIIKLPDIGLFNIEREEFV